jgi:hypothetical protein
VSEKINATFIVPDNLTKISSQAIEMCELFVAKVFNANDSVIEFKVDWKNMVVLSNNRSVKELISLYLKSRNLTPFYKQLIALAGRDSASDMPVLKIALHDKMYIVILHELNSLPSLHLRVSKVEVLGFNGQCALGSGGN